MYFTIQNLCVHDPLSRTRAGVTWWWVVTEKVQVENTNFVKFWEKGLNILDRALQSHVKFQWDPP